MLKELIKMAGELDRLGLEKEANKVDGMIAKLAEHNPNFEGTVGIYDEVAKVLGVKPGPYYYDPSMYGGPRMVGIYRLSDNYRQHLGDVSKESVGLAAPRMSNRGRESRQENEPELEPLPESYGPRDGYKPGDEGYEF
jgi:hypothetical protein